MPRHFLVTPAKAGVYCWQFSGFPPTRESLGVTEQESKPGAVQLAVSEQSTSETVMDGQPMEHRFENLPLVLVTGQARSGTTVLTHAFAAHPQIHSNLKESSIIGDTAAVLRVNLDKPGRRRDLTITPGELALNMRRFLLHSLFPSPDSPDLKDQDLGSDFPLAISTFSSLRVEDLDFVCQLFPRLVIANIYRNGVEVVASRMTHSHIGPQFEFEQHCVAWSHARDSVQWGAEKPNFVPFPHHELLDRSKTNLLFKQALDQIGILEVDACVDFVHSNVINTNNSPSIELVQGDTKSNARLAKRVDRWRQWTVQQRETFELKCGATMNYFNFELPWRQLPVFESKSI